MGSNSSATVQNTNPVLFSFGGITIEPYWLIITQLIVIQMLQRLYSQCACWRKEEHRTWYIALEIAILGKERAKTSPPKYSVLDFILSLISIIHFIYACVRQTYCSSSLNSSTWNCYNAFGYRLYNYVLPSVISVLVQSTVQVVNSYKARDDSSETGLGKKCLKWFKRFLLFSTFASNILICAIFLPYFITNAFPMLVSFCWLLIPLLFALILAYALFITVLVSIITKGGICKNKSCKRFFAAHCAVGLYVFGCLVLGMAFNFSQYCYFGAGYLPAVVYEFQSRDTIAWGEALVNSTELVTHNILAFF